MPEGQGRQSDPGLSKRLTLNLFHRDTLAMTASDFCLFEIETVGRQLEQAVDGLSAEQWEV